jgi:hypothetical protein
MKKFIFIAILFCSIPAYAVDKSQLFLVAGTDFASTVSTNSREMNPVMGQGWKGQAVAMTGSTALVLVLGKTLKDMGHPKAARVMNYIMGSVHFGAAGLNFRLGLK